MDANNRRVKIPFYNSDNCKKIRVVIEGINQNGLLTREEKHLNKNFTINLKARFRAFFIVYI